jgi:hypothetical protein
VEKQKSNLIENLRESKFIQLGSTKGNSLFECIAFYVAGDVSKHDDIRNSIFDFLEKEIDDPKRREIWGQRMNGAKSPKNKLVTELNLKRRPSVNTSSLEIVQAAADRYQIDIFLKFFDSSTKAPVFPYVRRYNATKDRGSIVPKVCVLYERNGRYPLAESSTSCQHK